MILVRFIVERIEDEIASLENLETGEMMNYKISDIPFKIYEGDFLIFEENCWQNDEEESAKRKERIKNKMKDLWST